MQLLEASSHVLIAVLFASGVRRVACAKLEILVDEGFSSRRSDSPIMSNRPFNGMHDSTHHRCGGSHLSIVHLVPCPPVRSFQRRNGLCLELLGHLPSSLLVLQSEASLPELCFHLNSVSVHWQLCFSVRGKMQLTGAGSTSSGRKVHQRSACPTKQACCHAGLDRKG
jgi:hypothetical protein